MSLRLSLTRRRFFLDVTMIRELCDRAEACLAQDR